ncbi:hypothetical protein BHE74_00037436 [Ensete ventricosum]|nr:hypothetical protein BHE74_00037436 [Ensete ventricosum]
MVDDCRDLPPGFRFHPTDEEIITYYVMQKIINHRYTARAIGEVDLNKCEPWDLPSKAKMGGKEMYFFCQKDRKYPTGLRTNRATEAGYWKATGKDKEICRGKGVLIGMKKTLVFYQGRAPRGDRTNWVMHEFRLEGKHPLPNLPKSTKDEWVVCRVFHKHAGLKKSSPPAINSNGDDLKDFSALPPLMEPPNMESNMRPSSSFIHRDQLNDLEAIPHAFFTAMAAQNQQVMNHHQMSFSNPPQNSVLHHPLRVSARPGYLHHDEAMPSEAAAAAMRKHRQSPTGCPSQETGVSTDYNTEISSIMSKHYEDFDEPWASFGF